MPSPGTPPTEGTTDMRHRTHEALGANHR